ncbi:unnamed protein product [Candida verbasci]|uniref:TAFII28-like protein domain-containing protein n=1 Tax=Candida verbasci TaxID=1227364 RepID=A0A9W4TQ04_9ASCO|nr:unnamed protein product [Candida verbasci]
MSNSLSDYDDSDVSLDEDDEELIWRVFFSQVEKFRKHQVGLIDDDIDDDDEEIEEFFQDYDNKIHTSETFSEETEDEDEDEGDDDESKIDDFTDIDDPELILKYKNLIQEKVDKNLSDEEKKKLLIASFTDDQMERFEAFRRSTINKPGVKKIVNGIVGHSIPQAIAIVIAGITKSFLGEIITKAQAVQERDDKGKLIMDIQAKKKQKKLIKRSLENGEEIEVDDQFLRYEGDKFKPLQPNHIREAWRLYQLENSSAFDKNKKDADSISNKSKHFA